MFLKDIWPSNDEIRALIDQHVNGDMFRARYADVYQGDERWRGDRGDRRRHLWLAGRLDLHPNPPYFEGMTMTPAPLTDIVGARALAVFGDSITTDHISPAGSIKLDSPAGKYLTEQQACRGRLQQLWRAPRQS